MTGNENVGPAAPSTEDDKVRVTDWPSPPWALAYRTDSRYVPAAGTPDTSWIRLAPVEVRPARKPDPV